jgi:hypothetical protein
MPPKPHGNEDNQNVSQDARKDIIEQYKVADLNALKQAWQELTPAEQSQSLIVLYERYTDRFLADNARIWSTAASMIPLSLGGFVVLASITRPQLFQVVLFPVASWILMSVWLVIAENHRAFQQASHQKLNDIERIWDFPSRPAKDVRGTESRRFDRLINRIASWLVSKNRVQRMRFMLWGVVTVGAVAVILFWQGGVISRL